MDPSRPRTGIAPLPARGRERIHSVRAPGSLAGGLRPRTGDDPTVSVIVPTYNEAGNVDLLLDRIGATLDRSALTWEVVVVDDDSADGTWRLVADRADADPRVRVVRRLHQRGLSSAVLAGMSLARGRVLLVLDADLQHDERRIPDLVAAIEHGADVCLASREADGGGYGTFGRRRRLMSRIGAALARLLLGVPVSDPMSGYFAVSRDRYRDLEGRLNPRGFKILLEFLARGPAPTVAEVGYVFGVRHSGSTKLSGPVIGASLLGLVELAVAGRLDRRRAARAERIRARRASASNRSPGGPA